MNQADAMLRSSFEVEALRLAGDGVRDRLGQIRHGGHVDQLRAPVGTPARDDAAPATAGVRVGLVGVSKAFRGRRVLDEIDLSVAPGEFVAIVGRSGCGKSTLLRLVAGLEQPSTSAVTFDGDPFDGNRCEMRIMFQDARLLPWKRVLDNVALGLRGTDALPRAREALAQVGLADRAGDWPAVLSGGQRQRVALARALVHAPRLLLLDEPLGALDALTRIEMQQLIEGLWRKHGFTALLVTHDVAEAVALADRVLLIDDHRIEFEQRIALPRPRSRGSAAVAALEERVLQRVLRAPPSMPALPSAADAELAGAQAEGAAAR